MTWGRGKQEDKLGERKGAILFLDGKRANQQEHQNPKRAKFSLRIFSLRSKAPHFGFVLHFINTSLQ